MPKRNFNLYRDQGWSECSRVSYNDLSQAHSAQTRRCLPLAGNVSSARHDPSFFFKFISSFGQCTLHERECSQGFAVRPRVESAACETNAIQQRRVRSGP